MKVRSIINCKYIFREVSTTFNIDKVEIVALIYEKSGPLRSDIEYHIKSNKFWIKKERYYYLNIESNSSITHIGKFKKIETTTFIEDEFEFIKIKLTEPCK